MMDIYDILVVVRVNFPPQLHRGGHGRGKKLACWMGVGLLARRLLVG